MGKAVPYAERVRRAIKELTSDGGSSCVPEIGDKMGIQERKDHKKIRDNLRDMMASGEVERTGVGRYRYLGKEKVKHERRKVMWSVLRMRRSVTVEDLAELGGCTVSWASEWLASLVKMEVVRNEGNGRYRLIKDTVEMPVSREKAEYLRERREKLKACLEKARVQLDMAENLLDEEMAKHEV